MSGSAANLKGSQSLQIDQELMCLICTELVDQARQVSCCGGLFCEACIDIWMRQQTVGGVKCPQCRAVLKPTNIVTDLRSDRKSAEQLRYCSFHEHYDCAFVGTRQEVAKHKRDCPCDPDRCKSQRCKLDKAKQEQTIAALQKTIDENNRAARNAESAARQDLIRAALSNPSDILKYAFGFQSARVFIKNFTNKYDACTYSIYSPPAVHDVDIVCFEGQHFASLYCYRNLFRMISAAPLGGYPTLKVTITLVSFDQAAVADHTTEVVLRSNLPVNVGDGLTNWLPVHTFRRYERGGLFALGWTVSILP